MAVSNAALGPRLNWRLAVRLNVAAHLGQEVLRQTPATLQTTLKLRLDCGGCIGLPALVEHFLKRSLPRPELHLTLLFSFAAREARIDPLLEAVVVDEDLIRGRAELLNQAKNVLADHLLTIVLTEDVVQLLLRQEAIPVRINLSKR